MPPAEGGGPLTSVADPHAPESPLTVARSRAATIAFARNGDSPIEELKLPTAIRHVPSTHSMRGGSTTPPNRADPWAAAASSGRSVRGGTSRNADPVDPTASRTSAVELQGWVRQETPNESAREKLRSALRANQVLTAEVLASRQRVKDLLLRISTLEEEREPDRTFTTRLLPHAAVVTALAAGGVALISLSVLRWLHTHRK